MFLGALSFWPTIIIFMKTSHSNFYKITGHSQTGLPIFYFGDTLDQKKKKAQKTQGKKNEIITQQAIESSWQSTGRKEEKLSSLVVRECPGHAQGFLTLTKQQPGKFFPIDEHFQVLKSCSGSGAHVLQKVYLSVFLPPDSPYHLATSLPFLFIWTWKSWRMSKKGEKKRP